MMDIVKQLREKADLAETVIMQYEAADEIESLRIRSQKLEAALVRLRDCDFVISLADRMDAVRDIARKALE